MLTFPPTTAEDELEALEPDPLEELELAALLPTAAADELELELELELFPCLLLELELPEAPALDEAELPLPTATELEVVELVELELELDAKATLAAPKTKAALSKVTKRYFVIFSFLLLIYIIYLPNQSRPVN